MTIPLYKTYWDEVDIEAVNASIRRGTHWAEGPNVEAFEHGLIDRFGVPGALICNSGTSALHLAVMACGIRYGQEVIVPSFTFIATVNAVRFVSATPVFADIEGETFGLGPADVERKITPKTRAIIAVHYGGQPCQIKELREIAVKHHLVLIEDAAEAMGAEVDGQPVGTFGHCGVLSFCANKIVSTGEGGALLTSDKAIYDRARLLRSHGRETGSVEGGAERYASIGYNFRMSDMAAALGLSQLVKMDTLIEKRREVARQYRARLGEFCLAMPESVYQLFTVHLPSEKRDAVMRRLQENNIGCKVYFRPVHLTDFYRRGQWQPVPLPVTETVSREVLSLPMYPGLTETEIDRVCQVVKEALCQ